MTIATGLFLETLLGSQSSLGKVSPGELLETSSVPSALRSFQPQGSSLSGDGVESGMAVPRLASSPPLWVLTCSSMSLARSSCSSILKMARRISSLESFNLQQIHLEQSALALRMTPGPSFHTVWPHLLSSPGFETVLPPPLQRLPRPI